MIVGAGITGVVALATRWLSFTGDFVLGLTTGLISSAVVVVCSWHRSRPSRCTGSGRRRRRRLPSRPVPVRPCASLESRTSPLALAVATPGDSLPSRTDLWRHWRPRRSIYDRWAMGLIARAGAASSGWTRCSRCRCGVFAPEGSRYCQRRGAARRCHQTGRSHRLLRLQQPQLSIPAELVESGVGAKLSDLLGQRSYRGSGD